MTVAIVTDSAAAIPTELAERHQVSVVPMWIHFGDATFAEGERPLGEFLGDERVTTSAPAPGDYEPRHPTPARRRRPRGRRPHDRFNHECVVPICERRGARSR